jgi:hypothetical protein
VRKVFRRVDHIPNIDDYDHVDCQKYLETIESRHDIKNKNVRILSKKNRTLIK